MNPAEPIHEVTFKVNTFECDFNHRLKPAAFFQRLTETAGEHAARLGFGYEAMQNRGYFWVLARMKVKFLRFPQGGETAIIRTWPKTIQQKLFYVRDFQVLDSGETPLALATSAWLVVDAVQRRMVPPQAARLDLPGLPDRAGLDEPLEKIGLKGSGTEVLRRRAGYSAVDVLGHVNNSRYVESICDAFPLEHYRHNTLDWLQVNYDHEVQPEEEVAVLVEQSAADAGLWTVEGLNRSNGTRAFEAALHWRELEL